MFSRYCSYTVLNAVDLQCTLHYVPSILYFGTPCVGDRHWTRHSLESMCMASTSIKVQIPDKYGHWCIVVCHISRLVWPPWQTFCKVCQICPAWPTHFVFTVLTAVDLLSARRDTELMLWENPSLSWPLDSSSICHILGGIPSEQVGRDCEMSNRPPLIRVVPRDYELFLLFPMSAVKVL